LAEEKGVSLPFTPEYPSLNSFFLDHNRMDNEAAELGSLKTSKIGNRIIVAKFLIIDKI